MGRDGAWRWLGWISLPATGLLGTGITLLADRTLSVRGERDLSRFLPDLALGSASPLVELAAATTLVLGLATVANFSFRAIGERHPARRFRALWLGAAGAALVVATAVIVGLLAAAPMTRSTLFGLAVGAAVRVVLWSLTWGLAGAAVATWLGPPRPEAALGPLLWLRVAVAGGLVLATCVSAAGLAAAVRTTSGWFPSTGDVDAATPTPAASAPAPSSDPSDPALLTNPDPEPAYQDSCTADAITITYQFADAALGRRFGVLTARNTTDRPCVLKGYPDLAFADVKDNNVRVKYEHGTWEGPPEKVRRIELDPGRSARAELAWRGDAGAYDREVDTILAAPWAGAKRTVIADRFDVKNGSVMTISPWLPSI